jgi:hypothetical protein
LLLDWLAVASIGALVGIGELVARYRDAPSKALITWPSLIYLSLNAGASLVALALIHTFGWTFGLSESSSGAELRWIQVLVAGFGAIALFRSSLFVLPVGDQEVGVGPSSFLQVVLGAADRAVDRKRGQDRAAVVSRAMSGVSFEKAHEALPTYCLALMQNLPEEDQEEFGRQLNALRDAAMEDRAKSLALGLAIMNAMGEDVLISAVETLGTEIKLIATPPQ